MQNLDGRLAAALTAVEAGDPPRAALAAALRAEFGKAPVAVAAPDELGQWRIGRFTDADAAPAPPNELFAVRADDPPLPETVAAGLAMREAGPPLRLSAGDGELAHNCDGALLAVPLHLGGGAPAALLFPAVDAAESPAWRERVALVASLLTAVLQRRAEAERRREADTRYHRELRQVARIQRRLLPEDELHIRGVEIAARLDTFGLAGGDYYDYMRLGTADEGPEPFGVMVADVTGHGAAAAVEAAMFDALLRAYPGGPDGPAAVLTFANRHFFSRQSRSHLISVFAARFRPETGRLVYTNAGHPPALVKRVRAGGQVERLEGGGGIPVGVLPDASWTNAEVDFAPGDLLVLYTDGVLEALSPSGGEFGAERLEDTLAESGNSPEEVLQAIRRAVSLHEAGGPPRDDRTLVVARRHAEL